MPGLSRIVMVILAGVIGALLFVSVFSGQNIAVKALDFTLKVSLLTPGYTELEVPPLGTVRAKTHALPVKISARLNNINLERLRSLIAEKPTGVFGQLVASFRGQIGRFVLRLLLLAFLGGLGAGLVFFRRLRPALLAALVGLAFLGLLLGGTWFTYREEAFKEPEFQGIIEVAPWLLGVAEEALIAINEIETTLEIVATNLLEMFDSLGQLGKPEGEGKVLKILHVSDIHNNALAASLALQTAAAFKADLVIDTGDITDYGTPIEGDLAALIADSGLPWFFVPGNHDSPAVTRLLGELANVTIMEGNVAYLEDWDLALAGIADPAAASFGMRIPPEEELLAAAERLKEIIRESGREPALIAAHNSRILEEFRDWPVVLLHGHSHRVGIQFRDQGVLIDAGTTGGAGVRGLIASEQVPYTMVLLHLRRQDENWRGEIADIITVNPQGAGFVLERKQLAVPAILLQEDEEKPPPPEEENNLSGIARGE